MIREVRKENEEPAKQPPFMLEEITDPALLAECDAVDRAYDLNEQWLKAHWNEVFPMARGKVLAVAEQELFIADTTEEVLTQAWAAHPKAKGIICQYVSPHTGPKVYACRPRLRGLSR
jgi:hypothetical protein